MASPFARYISGGVKRVDFGYYDSNGLLTGAVKTLANGEDSGMQRLFAVKTIDIQIPEPQRERQTGDDNYQGSLTFPSGEPVVLGIQTGVNDLDVMAGLQNINKYDDGVVDMVVLHPIIEEYADIAMIVNATAKKRVFGQVSTKGYEIHLINQGELTPGGADAINERTMRNYDYVLEADQTFAYPWGIAFAEANEGTLGGAGGVFTNLYKMTLHAYKGDGSTPTVTLDETPAGDDSTEFVAVYSYNGSVWSKLVNTTAFTLDPATKVLTFDAGSIPAAGDHVIIRYHYTD